MQRSVGGSGKSGVARSEAMKSTKNRARCKERIHEAEQSRKEESGRTRGPSMLTHWRAARLTVNVATNQSSVRRMWERHRGVEQSSEGASGAKRGPSTLKAVGCGGVSGAASSETIK